MVSVFVLSNLRGKREERERERTLVDQQESRRFFPHPLSLSLPTKN